MATRQPAKKKSTASSREEGREFFRRLAAEGPWTSVYILTGSETFLIQEAIDRLMKAGAPEGPDDFNFSAFDAKEDNADDVIIACDMLPMFKDRRLVRLRNLDAWKQGDLTTLANWVENPLDSTLLIITTNGVDQRLNAMKRIIQAPATCFVSFDELDTNDTIQWVGRRAQNKYRLRMTLQVAGQIVEYVGVGLDALDRALERLSLYVGKREEGEFADISAEIVDEIVADSRIRSVFEMTDALTTRDLARSVKIFRQMQLHGESPQGALSLIARQFRGILVAQEMSRGNLDKGQAAQLIGCPPFAVDNYLKHARSFRRDHLLTILQAITKTDHLLKSSRLDGDIHVERLMIQICRPS